MDTKTLGALILQELKFIRHDMKEEIKKLCDAVTLLHFTKVPALHSDQEMHMDNENPLNFFKHTLLKEQQLILNNVDHRNTANQNLDISYVLPFYEKNNYVDESHRSTLADSEAEHKISETSLIIQKSNICQSPKHEVLLNESSTSYRNKKSYEKIILNSSGKKYEDVNLQDSSDIPETCNHNIGTANQKLSYLSYLHSSNTEKGIQTPNVDFSSPSIDLIKKSKSTVGMAKFKCKLCSQLFSIYSKYLVHLKTHANNNSFVHRFSNRNSLQKGSCYSDSTEHANTDKKNYICEYCNKIFKQKHNLQVHMRIHTGEKPYKCSMCRKGFTQLTSLTKHFRIHTGEKPYTCTVCNKSFRQLTHLNEHSHFHTGEKPYACSICNKRFSRRSNLTVHTRIHYIKKPYTCSICSKGFTRLSNLTTHVRNQHNENL